MLKFGFILMVYSLVAGSALALVSMKSKPRIEENRLAAEEKSRRNVLPGLKGGYERNEGTDGFQYWTGYSDTDRQVVGGYIYIARGKGYSSTIESMVGVDAKGTVTGVNVLFQQETPGLGARIEEIRHGESDPWFLQQFTGRTADDSFSVAEDGGDIDSITGATISSRAMATSVRRGLEQLKENVGGFH